MILLLFYIFHVHLKLRIRFSRKCYIWTYNLCALYSRYIPCTSLISCSGGPAFCIILHIPPCHESHKSNCSLPLIASEIALLYFFNRGFRKSQSLTMLPEVQVDDCSTCDQEDSADTLEGLRSTELKHELKKLKEVCCMHICVHGQCL